MLGATRRDVEGTSSSSPLELRVHIGAVVKVLSAVVAMFVAFGTASAVLRLAGYPTAFGFVNLFNVDIEMSAPTWFSATLLMACAAVLAVLAVDAGRTEDPRTSSWRALTAVFVAMSVDEVAAYHESWTDRLRNVLDTSGIFYFAWVIPTTVLVGLLAAGLLPFLRSLPAATAVRFITAGAIFLSGALALEMVNGWYVERKGGDNHTYAALVGFEEVLEMVGAIAFLRAALLHLSTRASGVSLITARVDTGRAGPHDP